DLAGHRERAALLPDVLANGQRDVDASVADDGEPVAAHEVACLVEHAEVRQVMLEVRGDDASTETERRRVARAGPLVEVQRRGIVRAAVLVQVADDDGSVAEAGTGQSGRELLRG